MLELASRLEAAAQKTKETPADWLEVNYYVPEPVDPLTGELFPPGPIRFASHQKRLINEALSLDDKNHFKYATIIYSAVKKSGKSAIASGVAKYMANKFDYAKIFCLANDGKQSDDRLYEPVKDSYRLHEQLDGPLKGKARVNETDAVLSNNSKIEPIPCDAKGEAGSQPTATFWSELWGFDSDNKMKLWTEMTIPPTRWGRAIRWVESYAGFKGVSTLLWQVYELAVLKGHPHPDFLDLVDKEGNPVVWVNETAKTFAYWDTVPRMIWQSDDYYAAEAQILDPNEFRRIHRNEWVSPMGSFIEPEWWDACADDVPVLTEGSRTPAVVGIDAAISGDCAAAVLVTRDPNYPDTDIAIRACKIFKPGKKGINLEATLGKTIREWGKRYNIVCVAYDAYQMEKLAQDYRRGLVAIPDEEIAHLTTETDRKAYIDRERKAARTWYYNFSQMNKRAVADKQLKDMIMHRQIHWNPDDHDSDIAERGQDETLTKHIKQAGAVNTKDKTLRIEKLSPESKIDAAVALSMATDRCLNLNIDNKELDREGLIEQLRTGKITYDQFTERMSEIAMRMRVRNGD